VLASALEGERLGLNLSDPTGGGGGKLFPFFRIEDAPESLHESKKGREERGTAHALKRRGEKKIRRP